MNIFLLLIALLVLTEGIARLTGALNGRVLAIIWLIVGIILVLLSFGLIHL